MEKVLPRLRYRAGTRPLNTAGLAKCFPPNLKTFKVEYLEIWIQSRKGIKNLEQMLIGAEIDCHIVHRQYHMANYCDDEDVDLKLYFAELDVWKGLKGFKCIEDAKVQRRREQLSDGSEGDDTSEGDGSSAGDDSSEGDDSSQDDDSSDSDDSSVD